MQKNLNFLPSDTHTYIKVMWTHIEDMFSYFWFEYYFSLFANKFAVQTAQWHDLSTMHRLETAVKCTLHCTYFELFICHHGRTTESPI